MIIGSGSIKRMNKAFQLNLEVVHAINPVICLKVFFPERKTPWLGYLCKLIVSN
jgi:hypothetical protein